MGALDDLDLTLTLSRDQEAERLESAWTRLTQLRLTLGGLIGSGELGLADARRALDQHGLAEPLGEEGDQGGRLVGEISDPAEPFADLGD